MELKVYNLLLQMLVRGVIAVFLMLLEVSPKITLQKGLQQTQITLTDIHSFSQVLVEAQFSYIDSDRYQKVHLVVRASNRHKKQAYMDLIKKYNAIVRTLIKVKAIPNRDAMIQSIVHRGFLKRSRKWEFSRYFVVYGLKEDVPRILQKLQAFRLQTVKTAPVVHYLDEKFISIAAFIQAKLQLQKFIKQHLNSEYKILQTKDIEIMGKKVDNQQIIQQHIEQQFNNPKQSISISEQVKETKQVQGYYSHNRDKQNVPKKIIMKVLFQLVEKGADLEEILEEIEQGNVDSESISDFEREMSQEKWKDEETQGEESMGEGEQKGDGQL